MKIGHSLPNLRFKTHQDTIIHTLSLIGESELLFLVQDNVNTSVLSNLSESFSDLLEQNIEVYLITNNSPAENLEIQREQALPFVFISDEDGKLIKCLKARKSLFNPHPKALFLFGHDGKLRNSWESNNFSLDLLKKSY